MALKSINAGGMPTGDIKAIQNTFDIMSRKMDAQGRSYGENMSNVSLTERKKIVSDLASTVFDNDAKRAHGESAVASNDGIAAVTKYSLIKNLKDEFTARANNVVSGFAENASMTGEVASQMWSMFGSHFMSNKHQLILSALAPAVIKPIHNKIVKSFVTKDVDFEREVIAPYVFDEKGNTYDFYRLLNGLEDLEKINDGGQPKIRVTVPLNNKEIDDPTNNDNLCNIYNREGKLKDPANFRMINKTTDFIAKGVSIVSVNIDNEEYEVTHRSTGNMTQSGQLNTEIATISLTLTDSEDPKNPIVISGNVKADGKIYLMSNSDKVKGVTFEFIVPSKGAEAPLKVADKQTVLKHYIQRKATGAVTLNGQLIDDVNLKINKDIVTSFSEKVVQLVNAKKDTALITYINNLIGTAYNEDRVGRKYFNDESWESRRAVFAYKATDMTIANVGFTNFLNGGNLALAKSMFDVCNEIDVRLNPEEKRFSIFSSSAAAQWIKDASKADVTSFNLTGTATNEGGTIAGIATPYTLQSVQMSGIYSGKYIVTNKILSKEVTRTVLNTAGKAVNAPVGSHRYTLLTDFEDNMDGTIFAHGLEYITEGVNDNEFVRDKTLQYESRYDIMTYNRSLGVVDFIESPMSSQLMR